MHCIGYGEATGGGQLLQDCVTPSPTLPLSGGGSRRALHGMTEGIRND
jgi:hypothetical protein